MFRIAITLVTELLLVVPFIGCADDRSASMTGQAFDSTSDSAMVTEVETGEPHNAEAYDFFAENPFVVALTQPQSTFSIDVDTASYSNVRRFLSEGRLPPRGAVRIEELVNYFDYKYREPTGTHPISIDVEVADCPWQEDHQLVKIGLKGKSIPEKERPRCNLVFLLDVSGSMMQSNKLPLIKSALKLMVGKLHPNDRIAIVVYAGTSGLVLPSTQARHSREIIGAIDALQAGGFTNGAAGIRLAYELAEENFLSGGINRVLLCTDGDFNVGTSSQSELVDLITDKARSNVYLTVLGFGSGNLKDSTMEKLADKGNGNYAYIDTMLEARKVLVEQAGGTLVTIARDVKIQVDFNPRYVQSYRLLGYRNRIMANQDFRDDNKDAGEIGAGHTVTAFYEILPAGASPDKDFSRPSEFTRSQLVKLANATETMLTVNLRYKLPNSDEGLEFQHRVGAGRPRVELSQDFQFASAVVGFGMLLRQSSFKGSVDWDWVITTAKANVGEDPTGQRDQFVQLAKTARRLNQEE